MKKSFGVLVQQYLRTGGHTQQELAAELALHPKVLSRKLNGTGSAYLSNQDIHKIIMTLVRWRAIITRDEVVQLLADAGLAPTLFTDEEWHNSPLNELEAMLILPPVIESFDPPTYTPLHNLPAVTTRLVGREWAMERLRSLLMREDVRLVTLVGTGGCGKTRLALQLANDLLEIFPQGVWFVSLAGINDPALVPMSILNTLDIHSSPGSPPLQILINYLRNKQLLLILDNFEQLSEATTVISELLAAIPNLKLLVTSRVALHLNGEHEFRVPSLDLPDPKASLPPADLFYYSAVQLFVERAQAVRPDFAVTERNAAAIVQICMRLDGLPLALELAAARVKVLSTTVLLERLSKTPFTILRGGAKDLPERHKTLYSTIAWSYNLLSPEEQVWFRCLAIFSSGCTLEAVETMMQNMVIEATEAFSTISSIDLLTDLVDNNLLVQSSDEGGQVRFSMLETLREYAQEQMIVHGEYEVLRDWHACYYLSLAEDGEIGLRGSEQLIWLEQLEQERDNFRAALEWAIQRARDAQYISVFPAFAQAAAQGRVVAGSHTLSMSGFPSEGVCSLELSLRLAAALRPYWEWQGHLTEARYWLNAALSYSYQSETVKTQLIARAKALSEFARLTCLQNDQESAIQLIDESIALWRRLDEPDGLATALLHRSWVGFAISDFPMIKVVLQEGIDIISSANKWLHAQLLFYLASVEGFTGEFERMHECYAESKTLFEQVGDRCAIADLLKDKGGMMILEGKFLESYDSLLQSLQLCYELDHKQFITTGLGLLSFTAGVLAQPDPEQASINSALFGGAADSLMESSGFVPWTKTNDFIKSIRAYIRARIPETRWQEAWNAGRAMTVEQALELAQRIRTTFEG